MENNKVQELLMVMSISFDDFCDQYKKSRQGKVTKSWVSILVLQKTQPKIFGFMPTTALKAVYRSLPATIKY